MATFRNYYDDCYTSLFKSTIAEVSEDRRRLYLDCTYFYPTSGGQPHDLGSIEGIPVVDVVDEGEQIAHVLESGGPGNLAAGSLAVCRLDWHRRYDNMQQHTGQHLLSAVFAEIYQWKTLSFHMGEDVSSIELATGKLDDAQIDAVERRANELIAEGRPVRISYEDAEEASGLRKASARTGTLRIITIDSVDRSACGGTHVRDTAEIGPLQIRNLERVRGNVRVEFVCGFRALRHSKQDFRLLAGLARTTSVPPQGLEEHIAGLRGRLEAAEKALVKAKLQVARNEAEMLYENTPVSPDGLRRQLVELAEVEESARSLATAFAAQSRAVILVSPTSMPGTLILACSLDSGLHAGTLWKAAFAGGGGRGGGSATLAQGTVVDADAVERLKSSIPFSSATEPDSSC